MICKAADKVGKRSAVGETEIPELAEISASYG